MAKKQKEPVVQQLVIRPPQRRTSDISRWRTALKSADMGRMQLLYNLYEDLLIDGVLADAEDKRITAVTNSPLTFQDADGHEVKEITNLIDTPAFEEVIKTIMQARFWGRSGGEFTFTDEMAFTPIPPKHIHLESKSILLWEFQSEGIPYENDDHLLVLGKPRNFGLFLKTAPFAIWKRGGFGDYAEWLEIFGMPQRIGKYSSHDPQSRMLLEDALKKAGSAPWAVVPKETEIETVNNTGTSGSSTAHNDFRKACNEELLITILGQTMTTLDGSSRSQSQVHKMVEEGKNRSDLRYVRRVLNHYVLPLLEKRGYPVRGGKFVFPEAAEPLTVSDVVQLSKIIDIPADFLRDKYSIPAAEEGEAVAGKKETSESKKPPEGKKPGGEEGEEGEEGQEGKSNKKVENADRNFFKRLWDFFVTAPPGSGATNTDRLTLNDRDLHDRLIQQIREGARWVPELFDWMSTDLLRALDERPVDLADLGFAYNWQNDAFRTAQEMNLFHFSAAKSLAEIQMLNELYRKSKNFEEFYKAASDKLEVFNKTWQRTEWQTASLIAASTENYNRLKGKTNLFPYWQYKTVGDDKVRISHRKLHDVILPADDPRWDKIWPPNGWKCRCYVIAIMRHEAEGIDIEANRALVDAYFGTTEWKKLEAQGFGTNRAQSANVFKENEFYMKKFPTMAKKLLKNVTYQTYRLGSYEQMRQRLGGTLQRYQGAIDEFANALKHEQGKSFFTDYNGRSIELNPADFSGLPKKKAAYLTGVKETINTPDEVWINGDALDQYVFLKYFREETLAVIGQVKGGSVYKVKDWFKVDEKSKKLKHLLRHGLLIKKPE